MAKINLEGGAFITTGELPNGKWFANWTGPDGKGFGHIDATEQGARTMLDSDLAEKASATPTGREEN